jgi:hypothetical protein
MGLSCSWTGSSWQRTWGQGVTVGTTVIAGNCADQLGESFLIAQLLALANAIWHDEGVTGMNGHNTM